MTEAFYISSRTLGDLAPLALMAAGGYASVLAGGLLHDKDGFGHGHGHGLGHVGLHLGHHGLGVHINKHQAPIHVFPVEQTVRLSTSNIISTHAHHGHGLHGLHF